MAKEVDHTIQKACWVKVAYGSRPTRAASASTSELLPVLRVHDDERMSRCARIVAQKKNGWRDGDGDRDINQLRYLLSLARLPFCPDTGNFGS